MSIFLSLLDFEKVVFVLEALENFLVGLLLLNSLALLHRVIELILQLLCQSN